MFGFLKKFFGGAKGKKYESQRDVLQSGDLKALENLASDTDTHPEILYYLAKNENAEVRKAVALNVSTPAQASTLLATDNSVDVRLALAARLTQLLPGLTTERQSQIYAYAVQALGTLAQDEVLSVRRALSSTLRDYAKAPPQVVSRLARDVEREVSEPILRFCVALPDADLLDILSGHPDSWVVATIAARAKVGPKISAAVVDTGDAPGTAVLLKNPGAQLSVETLQKVIDRARSHPDWHQPIALRPEMNFDFARQLAGFVDNAVMNVLEKRGDFDPALRFNIASIVKRRMEYIRQDIPAEKPEDKVKRYLSAGNLTPEVVQDALAWRDLDFVVLSLSVLSGIHPTVVKKMISVGMPKPVIALCWKARLPMRVCIDIQRDAAKIHANEIMYAKGGTDYPISEADIKWQLEFFGVKD